MRFPLGRASHHHDHLSIDTIAIVVKHENSC
jgi:hypothetical protein